MTEQETTRQRELALLIELAPKLNEYRGDWQEEDELYCTVDKIIVHGSPGCRDCIWIPKTIDSADPERIARGEKPRGLWGMLSIPQGGLKVMTEYPNGTFKLLVGYDSQTDPIFTTTPIEALLLALKQQWKEER